MNRLIGKALTLVFAAMTLEAYSGEMPLSSFTSIVMDKSPSAWDIAAQGELQLYYTRITGRKLAVTQADGNTGPGQIYLGPAALKSGLLNGEKATGLSADGFLAVSDGSRVAILGGAGAGAVYGVYAFLEKAGVRIYAENCETLPPANTVIPVFNLTVNPAFEPYVGMSNFYIFTKVFTVETLMRWGYSPYRSYQPDKSRIIFPPGVLDPEFIATYGAYAAAEETHTMGYLCPPSLYLETHPDYYARGKNGEAFITLKSPPGAVKLCFSNPGVFTTVLSRLLAWIEKTPEAKYYLLLDGDTWDWCQCAGCRKLDPPGAACFPGQEWPVGQMSDRYLWFINRLAREVKQKYPDRILVAGIYQATSQPPELVKKAESNVRLLLCPYYTDGNKCDTHDLTCSRNARFLENLQKWHQFAPEQLYSFNYPMNYSNIYAPFFSLDSMVARMRYFHDTGVKGQFFCGQPYIFCRLFMYTLGKLRWNPEQAVEPLENQFLPAYYGPAAPAMKEFLALLRERVSQGQIHQADVGNACTMVSPEFIARADTIFARAETAVRGQAPYYERVRLEKLYGVLWADLDQYVTKDARIRMAKLKELVEICRSATDQNAVLNLPANMGITMDKWLEEKFSIRQDAEPWYDSTAIKALRACNGPDGLPKAITRLQKLVNFPQLQEGDTLYLLLHGFTVQGQNSAPIDMSGQFGLLFGGGDAAASEFNLTLAPGNEVYLYLRGRDDDKPGHTRMIVKLNGAMVFDGANSFAEDRVSECKLKLPAGCLKAGRNTLSIENPSPAETFAKWVFIQEIRLAPLANAWQVLKKTHYAPLMASEVYLYCPPGNTLTLNPAPNVFSPAGPALAAEIVTRTTHGKADIQLCFRYQNQTFKAGDRVRVTMWAKCNQGNPVIFFGMRRMAAPFSEIGSNASTSILFSDDNWKLIRLESVIGKDNYGLVALPNIFLGEIPPKTIVYFSPVLIEYQPNK